MQTPQPEPGDRFEAYPAIEIESNEERTLRRRTCPTARRGCVGRRAGVSAQGLLEGRGAVGHLRLMPGSESGRRQDESDKDHKRKRHSGAISAARTPQHDMT
jgi:hypothetical protein